MTCRCRHNFEAPTEFQSLSAAQDAELYALLRRNATSSDTAASELLSLAKEDLARCQKALRDIERERLRIEAICESLKNQKRALEEFLGEAESFNSPIRRCSPEILQEIFAALEPDNVIPCSGEMNGLDGVRVACVSKHWREIALETKQLWCSMDIKSCSRLVSGGSAGDSDHSHENHVKNQLKTIQMLLKRSGPLPLTLSLSGLAGQGYISELLDAHSSRWCRIVFEYETFGLLQTASFPDLRYLQVPLPFISSNGNVPSTVTDLTIRGLYLDLLDYPLPENPLSLDSLLHLNLQGMTTQWVWTLMKGCPALHSLTLSECRRRRTDNAVVQVICVPSLTSVVLGDCSLQFVKDFLSFLTAPQLEALAFDNIHDIRREAQRMPRRELAPFPFTDLKEMVGRQPLSMLKSLSLTKVLISQDTDLENTLKLFPSLETFKFCMPDGNQTGISSETLDSLFDRMNPTRQIPPQKPLVPKLLHLEMDIKGLSFTPTVFVDMIRSRWNPTSTSRRTCASLKTLVLRAESKLFGEEHLRILRVLYHGGMKILLHTDGEFVKLEMDA